MANFGYPPYSIPPPPVAPNMADYVYEIAVPPSPSGSPNHGGAKSPYVVYGGDEKGKQYYDDHSRLAVGRSSSTKEHRRASSVHGDSRDHRRDRSRTRSYYHGGGGRYEDEYRGQTDKVYYGHDNYYAESAYSGSSQGSREHSRERYNKHHRTPSAHSEMGDRYYDAQYPPGPPGIASWGPPVPPPPAMPGQPGMPMALAPLHPPPHHPLGQPLMGPGPMVPYHPPIISPEQEELNKKIAELQLELKKSKEESEKIEKTKAEVEAQRKKEEELKEAVKREIDARAAAQEKALEAERAERARIEAEAVRLLELKSKKEHEEKQKQEEEKARLEKMVEERLAVEAKKKDQLDLHKPTHTKFSKTHLCKEALDERKFSYTEHEDSFLVHRWVDRDEQNALWARTKQIRAYQLEYQKRFKEEADKAPVIDTPSGPVKIVRVGNNPPVTVPVVLVTKKAPVAEDVKFRHIFGMR